VKYSAKAHAAPATARPPIGGASRQPICPIAPSESTSAIATKMSLKPVSSLNCSSSTAGAARDCAT